MKTFRVSQKLMRDSESIHIERCRTRRLEANAHGHVNPARSRDLRHALDQACECIMSARALEITRESRSFCIPMYTEDLSWIGFYSASLVSYILCALKFSPSLDRTTAHTDTLRLTPMESRTASLFRGDQNASGLPHWDQGPDTSRRRTG